MRGTVSSLGKNFVLRDTFAGFRIPMLNKGGPPVELPSLWDTRVWAESLWMTHPGKRLVKDSVGQFLQTPDTGQDMK